MRTYIILLLSLLLSLNLARAQKFDGGILGGVVGSQVAGDQRSGYNKFGISAGGYIRLKLSAKWDVQMEMEYIQKGSRENVNPDRNILYTYKLNVNYIDIPLLLQFTPPSRSQAEVNVDQKFLALNRFTVEAGLDWGATVYHKETIDDVDQSAGPNVPGFTKSNLSFILGLYYNISERMRFNFRTNNSLLSFRTSTTYVPVGYVWRFTPSWGWGQYHDLLVMSLYYRM